VLVAGGEQVGVVTADRALAARVQRHSASVIRPGWLLDRLAGG
jgi:hypothetical protein